MMVDMTTMPRTTEAIVTDLVAGLDELRSEGDQLNRLLVIEGLWKLVRFELQSSLAADRTQAVRALRAAGWTLAEIGEQLGVNDSRVAQIAR